MPGAIRKDFLWGFATASAQIEGGGAEEDSQTGKGPSVCATDLSGSPVADRTSDMGRFLRYSRQDSRWYPCQQDLCSSQEVQGGRRS